MKVSKKVKIKLYIIPIFAIAFYLIIFGLMYAFYMARDEQAFKSIKEDTINSKLLNSKFGKITNVKYDNFMTWINHQNHYECIKFKVYTDNNTYKVCTIFKDIEYGGYAIGYIIDGKTYMEDN